MKKIGVVILSYKNTCDTIECLESIHNVNVDDYILRIILVDNSENDVYAKEIKKVCPYLSDVILCKNDGYSAGNNNGIRAALEDSCDYVVVINNDTVVDKDFLMPLINALNRNPKSLVAPMIYNFYTKRVWSSGGKFRPYFGDYRMLYDYFKADFRKTQFISGCCFATTSTLLKDIGLLNENYFMYCEDNDFCKRVLNRNYDMFVLKDSTIYHKVGASTKGYNEFQLYYIYRNRLFFCRSYFKGLYKSHCIFVNKARAFLKMIIYKIRGKKNLAKALSNAIKDSKHIEGVRRY